MQRDPLGYVDGMSTYAYYAGMRGGLDPLGLNNLAKECPEAYALLIELRDFHQSRADGWGNLASDIDAETDRIDSRLREMNKWMDKMLESQKLNDLKKLLGLEQIAGLSALTLIAELNRHGVTLDNIAGTGTVRDPKTGRYGETRLKKSLNRMNKAKAPGVALVLSVASEGGALLMDIFTIQGEVDNMMGLRNETRVFSSNVNKIRNLHLRKARETQQLIDELGTSDIECDSDPCIHEIAARAVLQNEKRRVNSGPSVNDGRKFLGQMKDLNDSIWDNAVDTAN